MLRAFSLSSSVPLDLNASGDTWIQIGKTGEWHGYVDELGQQHTLTITCAHLESAKLALDARESELLLDYEHASTIPGSEAPAAGWIDDLDVRGDELWAHVRFTKRAADHVRAGEYRFTSPVWLFESPDRETGEVRLADLFSVALTNTPFQDGLQPVVLSRKLVRKSGRKRSRATGSSAQLSIVNQGAEMNPEESTALVAEIMKALGVDDPAMILDAVKALAANAAGAEMKATETAALSALRATHAATVARLSQLEAIEATRAASEKEIAAQRAVADVIDGGRALPAAREALVSFARTAPEAFAEFAKGLPQVVPMTRQAQRAEMSSGVERSTDPVVVQLRRAGVPDAIIARHTTKI